MHFTEAYSKTELLKFIAMFSIVGMWLGSSTTILTVLILFIFFSVFKNKLNAFFYVNIFLGVFLLENFFKIDTVQFHNFNNIDQLSSAYNIYLYTSYKALCVVIYFFIIFLASKNKEFGIKEKILIYLFPFFVSTILLKYSKHNVLYPFLVLLLIMLSKSVFYILYYFECKKLNIGIFSFKNFFQPFCFPTSEICIPSPRYIGIGDKDKSKLIFKSLISIVIYKCIGIFIANIINYLILKDNQIILDEVLFFNQKLIKVFNPGNKFGLLEIFLITFGYGTLFLQITFFTYSRVFFIFLQFMGFSIPDTIDSPEKSKSFSDFFSRTMHYYNLIINYFFFFPLMKYAKNFGIKVSANILLFIALVFGGLYIHALKDIYKLIQLGLFTYLQLLIQNIMPYLCLLALAIIISHKYEKQSKSSPLKVLFYLFYYCSIVSLTTFKHFNDIKSFFDFYWGWLIRLL